MTELLNLIYNPELPESSRLDIFLPDEASPQALLLHFHGGGLEEGDRTVDPDTLEVLLASGIAVATASYRLYPSAKFPDFVNDAAAATAFIKAYMKQHYPDRLLLVGGTSAGAYLSQMLYFNPVYLAAYGLAPDDIDGWLFDGGQPTVHYNVLRERGLNTGLVRVDEASPLYYVGLPRAARRQSPLLFLLAQHDIPGRLEQTRLLIKTMEVAQFDMDQVKLRIIPDVTHSAYRLDSWVIKLAQWAAGDCSAADLSD
ncbi:alpha/beta hydrolase fold domain-containing protein [Oscillospiraceae bacterium HV4-5-C5C]|nr:alpha/beta hydrolase fold domain-containing protein [Oscillospiraceae bacterium HV4-5-C5C]